MLNVFLKSCDFQGWSYSEIYNFTISGIHTSAATPNFFYEGSIYEVQLTTIFMAPGYDADMMRI